MSTVKLKRLKIDQYRNVKPGTELHFDDGVNLVLGQNGSGKTTLLNLISAIVSHDLSHLEDEPFDFQYELSTEQCQVAVHLKSRPRHDFPDQDPDESTEGSLSHSQTVFRIHLTFGETQSVEVLGTHSKTTVQAEDGSISEHPPVSPFAPGFVWDAIAEADNELLSSFYREILALHVGHAPRFDESLDCFLAMTGRSPVLPGIGSPEITRLRFRERISDGDTLTTVRKFAPQIPAQTLLAAHNGPGGELRIDTTSKPTPDVSSGLDFLRNTAFTMGMTAAALKPEIRSSAETRHRKTFEIHGFSFTFTRPGNITNNHDLLSYGQKRLLAYFYYLAATSAYVIADELVNGLHHRWIKACMDAIGERQAFLTSQNPLLFDYVEFDSIEQVEARFITCKSELVDGAEQLVWQNMPRDDAARFYEAYTDEIEQVGEILITRGLW